MIGFAYLILIQGLFFPGGASGAEMSCKNIRSCHLHQDPSVQAQVMACEAVVHSDDCKSLGKDVKLRDCESEALCPNDLDQSYVIGCLSGGVQYAVDLVTAPVKLLQAGLSEDLDHARYNNAELNKSCRENEKKITIASPKDDLDCEGDFFHAACPKAVVRNCKYRLLENFPDLKAKYGDGLGQTPYDEVLDDVHARLRDLKAAQPSLQKFLAEHPDQPLKALSAEIKAQLDKQGYKFRCLSAYDISNFSCKVVLDAATAVAAGSHVLSKLRNTRAALGKPFLDNGRAYKPGQPEALERAHFIGVGEEGKVPGTAAAKDNYTKAQLLDKFRLLRAAGFSDTEIDKLIRNGVVGLEPALAAQRSNGLRAYRPPEHAPYRNPPNLTLVKPVEMRAPASKEFYGEKSELVTVGKADSPQLSYVIAHEERPGLYNVNAQNPKEAATKLAQLVQDKTPASIPRARVEKLIQFSLEKAKSMNGRLSIVFEQDRGTPKLRLSIDPAPTDLGARQLVRTPKTFDGTPQSRFEIDLTQERITLMNATAYTKTEGEATLLSGSASHSFGVFFRPDGIEIPARAERIRALPDSDPLMRTAAEISQRLYGTDNLVRPTGSGTETYVRSADGWWQKAD